MELNEHIKVLAARFNNDQFDGQFDSYILSFICVLLEPALNVINVEVVHLTMIQQSLLHFRVVFLIELIVSGYYTKHNHSLSQLRHVGCALSEV